MCCRVSIVCPDLSGNALGRSIVLYELLKDKVSVEIVGIRSGNGIWNGCDFFYPIKVFKGKNYYSFCANSSFNRSLLKHSDAIIISKPLFSSLFYTLHLLKGDEIRIILDVDDHEVALFDEIGILLNIRDFIKKPIGPNNWILTRLMQHKARSSFTFDKMLFSSEALAEYSGASGEDYAVIPHVKPPSYYGLISRPSAVNFGSIPRRNNEFVLGFVGTCRGYKGVDFLIENVAKLDFSDFQVKMLVTDKNSICSLGNDRLINQGYVRFNELARLYEQIDAVVLLQSTNSSAAIYQLPSKLFDAMFFSKPVIATNTPVLREHIRPDLLLDEISVSELRSKLELLVSGDRKSPFLKPYENVLLSAKEALYAMVTNGTV